MCNRIANKSRVQGSGVQFINKTFYRFLLRAYRLCIFLKLNIWDSSLMTFILKNCLISCSKLTWLDYSIRTSGRTKHKGFYLTQETNELNKK